MVEKILKINHIQEVKTSHLTAVLHQAISREPKAIDAQLYRDTKPLNQLVFGRVRWKVDRVCTGVSRW